MTRIHRILVPIDFSEHSERALEDAVALAKKFEAELHLIHCYQVYPESMVSVRYELAAPAMDEQQVRDAALGRLTDWREKATAQGVSAELHLAMDRPSHGIVSLAEKLPADLIVIGTWGLTGLQHVLLGSVAERVIRHAPCPVLTVKGR